MGRGGSLSPERLQAFQQSLSAMSVEDARKAKVLYLKNAIAEYRAMQESMRSFKEFRGGCLFSLPIFGGIKRLQDSSMETGRRLQEEQILNTMKAWEKDLEGEEIHFPP